MLKILIVSGIWPPDIGGPASHGPDLGRFLQTRGHAVHAIASTPDGWPESFGFPVRGVRRDQWRPARLVTGLTSVCAATQGMDVVYSTGMYTRSAIAARVASVPLSLKVVNDPAYERAQHLGLFSGSMDEFQADVGGAGVRALKAARDVALGRASRIVTPGRYLKRIAVGWGLEADRIEVVPNPAEPADTSVPREELRRRFGMEGPTFVFAGRFVRQKNVALAVRALRHVPEASLVLIGEGPEEGSIRHAIEAGDLASRVSMKGAMPKSEAMQWVRAADVCVLPSAWEGFPHAAVESVTVGTPVIATSVGAVPEIVEAGHNGLLVQSGDDQAFGAALASATRDDGLMARLREGAAQTGDRYAPERTFAAIEAQIVASAGPGGP